MTTQAAQPKQQYGYRIIVSETHDYLHASLEIMKPHEWRAGAWEGIGEFRFQADRENDFYGDAGKQHGVQMRDGFKAWYSGEKVNELWGDNIDEQLENLRAIASLYKRMQAVQDRYNLRYKYDKLTAMIAALNRLGVVALEYDRETDKMRGTGKYDYYV